MAAKLKSLAIGLAIMLSAASPASALDSCSCRNLESLQQELANAVYETGFFESLSQRLDVIEKKQIEINKDPTNSESGKLVLQVSANARKDIMAKEFKPPHPKVTGYSGPETVDMEAGKCKQDEADLEAMRKGSACQEIADITSQHEAAHRELCKSMGADTYWGRLPSVIAAEEAERYRAQAEAMRGELKRVIDEGTLTVEAIMEPRIRGPQFDVTYSYVTADGRAEGQERAGFGQLDARRQGQPGRNDQEGQDRRHDLQGERPAERRRDAVVRHRRPDDVAQRKDQVRFRRHLHQVRQRYRHVDAAEEREGGGTWFKDTQLKLTNQFETDVSDAGIRKDDQPERHVGERHPQDDRDAGLPGQLTIAGGPECEALSL